MKIARTIIFIYIFLQVIGGFGHAQNSNPNEANSKSKDSLSQSLKLKWKYNTNDKSDFASVTYDDKNWPSTKIRMPVSDLKIIGFNGIIWFRSSVIIPKHLLNKTLCLNISHNGASEIYVDGIKIGVFGKVSSIEKDEVRFDPAGIPLPVVFRGDSSHMIAIRYSNHKVEQYIKWDEFNAGIEINIEEFKLQFFDRLEDHAANGFFLLIMGGFLLGLTLIHIFFFLFYRKQKEHFYYSLFTFSYATLFIIPYFSVNSFNPDFNLPLSYFTPAVIPFYFISLVGFINYLVRGRLPLLFWFLIGIGFIIILGFFFKFGHNEIFYFLLISLVIHQSISVLREGKRLQVPGLKVISRGFTVFFILIGIIGLFFLASAFGLANISFYVGGFWGFVILALVFCGVLSIPISISLYLARNFATINISLENKLREVEELSSKMIEQEKEKKKILEEQNVVLEKEVALRTSELLEKNKDITDSIQYAKRIQYTLLAHENLLKENLGEYFVLFQPKDIVSGDFYWATKRGYTNANNQEVERFYLAVCDSTGHGVPGAFMSLLNISFLNEAIGEKGIIEPGQVLDYVRNRLIASVSQDGAQDGMDAVLICIETNSDKTKKQLTYAAANNSPVLIRDKQIVPMKVDKMPVGKGEKDIPFSTHSVEIFKGDSLFLFTDGYADQFGGPKGKKFKYKQLHEIYYKISDEKSDIQKSVLAETFKNWVAGGISENQKNGYEQIDDVCIVGIRF